MISRTASNKGRERWLANSRPDLTLLLHDLVVFPEPEGDVEQGDPWATLKMTPQLIQVLKSNGIKISTAKELQEKLGVEDVSDIQIIDEDMLKSLAASPIEMKKIREMIGR